VELGRPFERYIISQNRVDSVTLRISRRNFLKLLAGGAAAVVGAVAWLTGTDTGRTALDSLFPSAAPQASRDITLNVNGADHHVQVDASSTLLGLLRDDLGLTGTKPGCSNSSCGACTVLLDGTPVYSCQRLAVEADGHKVTTIEGLGSLASLSPLQQAFIDEGAFQCGYCTPGFIVAATALLQSNPNPTAREVREGLSGNICRCGSYPHITKAVLAAAQGGQSD
jgi:aerobic-type carbon monoxide dehydrogenase small subunit (CoxS/CutS family)